MKHKITNDNVSMLSRQLILNEHMLSRKLTELGSKGGQTRAQTLTIKQRKDIASKAANARWAQEKDN